MLNNNKRIKYLKKRLNQILKKIELLEAENKKEEISKKYDKQKMEKLARFIFSKQPKQLLSINKMNDKSREKLINSAISLVAMKHDELIKNKVFDKIQTKLKTNEMVPKKEKTIISNTIKKLKKVMSSAYIKITNMVNSPNNIIRRETLQESVIVTILTYFGLSIVGYIAVSGIYFFLTYQGTPGEKFNNAKKNVLEKTLSELFAIFKMILKGFYTKLIKPVADKIIKWYKTANFKAALYDIIMSTIYLLVACFVLILQFLNEKIIKNVIEFLVKKVLEPIKKKSKLINFINTNIFKK